MARLHARHAVGVVLALAAASAAGVAAAAPCPRGQELREQWHSPTQVKARGCVELEPGGDYRLWGVWQFFYPDGQKKEEGAYRGAYQPREGFIGDAPADQRDGRWVFWYANGKKRQEGGYRAGKRDGPWVSWFENGKKQEEGSYEADRRQGHWVSWFPTGRKKEEGGYKAGARDGAWVLRYVPVCIPERPPEDGKRCFDLDRWPKHAEGRYKAGERDGPWVFWRDEGKKEEEGSYERGKREGRWVTWHPNGQKSKAGTYAAGEREGLWVFFNEDGEKDEQRTGTYRNGQAEVPAAVVEFDRELKRRLLDTLDLASELRGSCQEIVAFLRAGEHVAEEGLLLIAPAFTRSATDTELCRLYISRAVLFFEFMIAGLSERPFANLDKMEEDASEREREETVRGLFARFWPERPLPTDLDPESDAFLDEFFPRISTREDLARYDKLLEGYHPLATHGIPWKTRVLDENERYLDDHHPWSRLQRDVSDDWPKRVFGTVYESRLLGVVLFIGERDGQLKLIYLVPFSQ